MFWRRKTLRTPKLARKHRRLFVLKIVALCMLVAGAVVGGVYLLNREEVLLSGVVVSGTEVLDAAQLEREALEHIEGKYLFTIPRSSVFLYPKYSIAAGVLESFKRVKEVEVYRGNWRTLHVDVVERKPHTQWCGENRLEGVVPECYFLDEDGYIYALAPASSGDAYFHFYGPIESGEPVGQYFLERGEYRALTLFLTTLREAGIAVEDLAVRDEMDYELYLKDGTQVILGRGQDLGRVYENLKSVLLSDAFEEVDLSTVEYIDLRFGNKVYYKLKNETEGEEVIEDSREQES